MQDPGGIFLHQAIWAKSSADGLAQIGIATLAACTDTSLQPIILPLLRSSCNKGFVELDRLKFQCFPLNG
jgi:hypothetical protein